MIDRATVTDPHAAGTAEVEVALARHPTDGGWSAAHTREARG